MNRKTKLVISLLMIVPFFLVLMATSSDAGSAKAIYKSKCQMCHGPDGKAATKAGKMMKVPDLTQVSNWKHGTSQAEVEKIIHDGAGKMPKYSGKLNAEQITAVAHLMKEICGVAGK